MAKTTIGQSVAAYEAWLKAQLGDEFVPADLKKKHARMQEGPFPFLRATYWRWAETIPEACPEMNDAPAVLAVGDIHLENFGVWRDAEGRLVWGVNDFDEAAEMPYALDLLRLATSAILGRRAREMTIPDICSAIWTGYGDGLAAPLPFVLDERQAWLRNLFVAGGRERAKFWRKLDGLKRSRNPVPARYRDLILAAVPEAEIGLEFRPRTAGTGSLGRPRWVGMGAWRGGRLVREAKALVPSGWVLAADPRARNLHVAEIVAGDYRAPDPWYRVLRNTVVRRLSPNSHKIEVTKSPDELINFVMLRAMGHELANIHLGTRNRNRRVKSHFDRHDADWLRREARKAAKLVADEFAEWTSR